MKQPLIAFSKGKIYLLVGVVLIFLMFTISGVTTGRTLVVNQQHSSANDKNPGTENRPVKTISRAAELAQPGDTVLVHAGVYRERVSPARGGEKGRPIVYMAAPDEVVYIKGSDVWKPKWQAVKGQRNVYLAKLDPKMFGKYNPYRTDLLTMENRTCGQIFVDGGRLKEMGSVEEVYATPGSWRATGDHDGIYVHFPGSGWGPEKRLVELTTRGRIFAPYKRGLSYIQVKGFNMEHCGNNYPATFYWTTPGSGPQAGALGCRGGHHWVIENNSIRWTKTIGLDCGTEGPADADGLNQPQSKKPGHHLIRNNIISDNGACGVAGYKSLRTKIIGNVFERNNNLGFNASEEGGVKTHFFIGGLIEGNLFRDNETFGLWLDNVWAQTRVTRNVFVNNRDANILLEMGGGPLLIDNNIIALCRDGWNNASGIYATDSGGVTMAHNLFVYNKGFAMNARKAGNRSYRVYPRDIQWWDKGWDGDDPLGIDRVQCVPVNLKLFNNLFLGGWIDLPLSPGPLAQGNESDYNLFTRPATAGILPFIGNHRGPSGKVAGLSYDQIVSQLAKAYEQENASAKKGTRARYLPKVKKASLGGAMLNFQQWKLLGMDEHSRMNMDPRSEIRSGDSVVVKLVMDKSAWELGCKSVKGVDKDFFGNPMPENPVPGPFQNVKKGGNFLTIWPVKGTESR